MTLFDMTLFDMTLFEMTLFDMCFSVEDTGITSLTFL